MINPKTILPTIAILSTIIACSPPQQASVPPEIDAARALDYAVKIYNIGPKPSGSPGAEKTVDFIAREIRETGLEPIIDTWREQSPAGMLKFQNVSAHIPGKSDEFVIVGCHYDTKNISSIPDFAGANDGASACGLLLAMIQAVSKHPEPPPLSLRFIFFDGEECLVEYSENDGLHGSRHYAANLVANKELDACRAVIILDMIGDKDLSITIPTDSDPELRDMLLEIAEKNGHSQYFTRYRNRILDDHSPFQKLGIPAIVIIDFEYGPGNRFWHTSADTIDKISAQSLGIAGKSAMELIWKLND